MNRTPRTGAPGRGNGHQGGVVLIMVALSLAILVAISGLALDGAHTMISKTRLQNAVDASALSAAKTLDQTRGDTVLSELEALATFSDNASDLGNGEVRASYDADELNLAVEFSNTLIPFVSGTAPALYVRVTATNLRLRSWLIPVMGVDETVVDNSPYSARTSRTDPVTDACTPKQMRTSKTAPVRVSSRRWPARSAA